MDIPLLKQTSDLILKDAKNKTHVDTGKLKKSIKSTISKTDISLSQLDYGEFVKGGNQLELSIAKNLPPQITKTAEDMLNIITKPFQKDK